MSIINSDGIQFKLDSRVVSQPTKADTLAQMHAVTRETQGFDKLNSLISIVKNGAAASIQYSQSVDRIKQQIQSLEYLVDINLLAESLVAEDIV